MVSKAVTVEHRFAVIWRLVERVKTYRSSGAAAPLPLLKLFACPVVFPVTGAPSILEVISANGEKGQPGQGVLVMVGVEVTVKVRVGVEVGKVPVAVAVGVLVEVGVCVGVQDEGVEVLG